MTFFMRVNSIAIMKCKEAPCHEIFNMKNPLLHRMIRQQNRPNRWTIAHNAPSLQCCCPYVATTCVRNGNLVQLMAPPIDIVGGESRTFSPNNATSPLLIASTRCLSVPLLNDLHQLGSNVFMSFIAIFNANFVAWALNHHIAHEFHYAILLITWIDECSTTSCNWWTSWARSNGWCIFLRLEILFKIWMVGFQTFCH